MNASGDLAARDLLCDLGMVAPVEGASILLHAEIYLSDRLRYQLFRADMLGEVYRTAMIRLGV